MSKTKKSLIALITLAVVSALTSFVYAKNYDRLMQN